MDEGFFPSNFPVGQSPKEAEKKKLNQLAPSSSLGTSYNK
jgi:hypothetical protein